MFQQIWFKKQVFSYIINTTNQPIYLNKRYDHLFFAVYNYYASCIKNNQGYSLNQWAENKLRDESYVNCQFIIASNVTLYTVRKSVCESG
jgi:hypothetical protein